MASIPNLRTYFSDFDESNSYDRFLADQFEKMKDQNPTQQSRTLTDTASRLRGMVSDYTPRPCLGKTCLIPFLFTPHRSIIRGREEDISRLNKETFAPASQDYERNCQSEIARKHELEMQRREHEARSQQLTQILNVAREYEEKTQTIRSGVYFNEGIAAALAGCINPKEGSSHLQTAHTETRSSIASTDKK